MKKRLYYIEGIRFIFSAIIVYFHILYSSIMSFTGGQQMYLTLQENAGKARLIVECFLVMGGYFLYQSYCRNPDQHFLAFAMDRLVRLWPAVAFNALIGLAFMKHSGDTPVSLLFDVLFLQATGLSDAHQRIIWYVGPFFWCSLLLYAILKLFHGGKRNCLIAVLVYFGYVINIGHGGLGSGLVDGIWSLGMLRVLAGLGLGCLIGIVLQEVEKCYGFRQVSSVAASCVFTVLEIGLFGLLLCHFLLGVASDASQLLVIVLFTALFICLICGNSYLTRIFNWPWLGVLGRYSYSIYVTQQNAFRILKRTLWQNSEFVYDHALWCLAVSTLLSVLLGIAVYYLVEYPIFQRYQKWKKCHPIREAEAS